MIRADGSDPFDQSDNGMRVWVKVAPLPVEAAYAIARFVMTGKDGDDIHPSENPLNGCIMSKCYRVYQFPYALYQEDRMYWIIKCLRPERAVLRFTKRP